MDHQHPLQSLSDNELLRRLKDLVQQSRRVEADLVAHIAEVDERRLFAREAVSSMFAYATERLHLSEAEAYLRIEVARASRKHPMLLTMLRDGRLHLSGIAKLAPHLTLANRDALLKRATHQSKRKIEIIVAELAPRPDVQPAIRKLPERRVSVEPVPQHRPDGVAHVQHRPDGVPSASTPAPADQITAPSPAPVRPATVEPLATARFKVQFTASAELRDKLERLQSLMRSSDPDIDLASTIDAAVTRELERLEARRFAKTTRPRKALEEVDTTPSSRYIPAPVRRAVHERDRGQCRYVDKQGRRCSERHRLEFHHHNPYGRGGEHSAANIRLMCRTHNALLAEQDYGKEVMARYRGSGASRVREAPAVYGLIGDLGLSPAIRLNKQGTEL